MRVLAWLGLLVTMAGCGGGSGRLALRISVRIQGLSAQDLGRVRSLELAVTGDSGGSDGAASSETFNVAPGELSDGIINVSYLPKKRTGVLRFKVTLLAQDGTEIASGESEGDLRSRDVVVEVRGNEPPPDGGVTPPDGGGTPDGGGSCADVACSGTVADDCCPAGCTPASDADCAGCGNGRIETGETCDPPGSCPVCDDQNDCTTDTSTGSAATCDLVCANAPKTCSTAGKDRCCPIGCSATNDADCAACGDGTVDATAGETCDPPSSCPGPGSCVASTCSEVKTFIGSAATCNARCSTTIKPCSGATADGCCPAGCNTSTTNRDVDCAAMCGNGITEAGERCDPLTSCPSTCPPLGCLLRRLENAGSCQATCAAAGTQSMCANGDGCCPTGCSTNTDSDCAAMCGNGVVETGELCDGNCPNDCPQQGCNLRMLAGTGCQRQCVSAGTQTTCATGDGCCPMMNPACNANNDAECGMSCGNGVVETGELCDGNCPSDCPQQVCNLRMLTGTGCQRQCVSAGTQTMCKNGDGCCPDTGACNSTNDSECTPACGNGVVEMGEKCDGNCPTACPQMGCNVRALMGTECQRECVVTGTQQMCTNGDSTCCPQGCNANNDSECAPTCGNSVVETGELCDGNCPTTCRPNGCNLFTVSGTGCQRQCVAAGMQTVCMLAAADGCCPPACNATNDIDCRAVCPNGVVEAGEKCDGNCPATVADCQRPGGVCELWRIDGTLCQRECVLAGTQMACTASPADGCCPSNCNARQGDPSFDADCQPVCDNGVIEPPKETCDPLAACEKQKKECESSTTCDDIATGSGNSANCTFSCTITPRPCGPADGCCPRRGIDCQRDMPDPDCASPPANDTCARARDISDGGVFPVDFTATTKQDIKAQCAPDGPDLFYGFRLTGAEYVYLGVVDPGDPMRPVAGVSIELIRGTCADPTGVLCGDSDNGKKFCGGEGFPMLDPGAVLPEGQYLVVVRAPAGTVGRFRLHYSHVPQACFAANVKLRPGDTISEVTTCRAGNNTGPSCLVGIPNGEDLGFLMVNCPNHDVRVSTCTPSTALSAVWGSQAVSNSTCVPLPSGMEVGCATTGNVACPAAAALIPSLGLGRPGLVVISADSFVKCGAIGLSVGRN